MRLLKFHLLTLAYLLCAILPISAQIDHIIYVSDLHYGITRTFRGEEQVPTRTVGRAMIEHINTIPSLTIPRDGGVGAGEQIGSIKALINTGDIVNRMERGALQATESWSQFREDWFSMLTLKSASGEPTPQYLTVGNHEISNAIGHYRLVMPIDPTPYVEIYNYAMKPKVALTNETFDYKTHKLHYSFEMSGHLFLFPLMWCDSYEQAWINEQLKGSKLPALIFTHDPPQLESKHLTNPNGDHSINGVDRFENLIHTTSSVTSSKEIPVAELESLGSFFASTPQIKGYFHGDDNYHEFYRWSPPSKCGATPIFRVDSPMKGNISRGDDSKLSYMLITIDNESKSVTVRQILWNVPDTWGETCTIQ